jgi:hypothetical protein
MTYQLKMEELSQFVQPPAINITNAVKGSSPVWRLCRTVGSPTVDSDGRTHDYRLFMESGTSEESRTKTVQKGQKGIKRCTWLWAFCMFSYTRLPFLCSVATLWVPAPPRFLQFLKTATKIIRKLLITLTNFNSPTLHVTVRDILLLHPYPNNTPCRCMGHLEVN